MVEQEVGPIWLPPRPDGVIYEEYGGGLLRERALLEIEIEWGEVFKKMGLCCWLKRFCALKDRVPGEVGEYPLERIREVIFVVKTDWRLNQLHKQLLKKVLSRTGEIEGFGVRLFIGDPKVREIEEIL